MNVMVIIPKIHLQDIRFSVLFLIFWENGGQEEIHFPS